MNIALAVSFLLKNRSEKSSNRMTMQMNCLAARVSHFVYPISDCHTKYKASGQSNEENYISFLPLNRFRQ